MGKLMYLDKTDDVDCLLCGSRSPTCDQILYGNRLDWASSLCKAFNIGSDKEKDKERETFLYMFANAFYCLPCNNELRKIHKAVESHEDGKYKVSTDPKVHCTKMTIVANFQRLVSAARSHAAGLGGGYQEHDKIRAAVLPKLKGDVKNNPLKSSALIKRIPLADAVAYKEPVLPRTRKKASNSNNRSEAVEVYTGGETDLMQKPDDSGKITVVLDVHNDGEGITKIERVHQLENEADQDHETMEVEQCVENVHASDAQGDEVADMPVGASEDTNATDPLSDSGSFDDGPNDLSSQEQTTWITGQSGEISLIKSGVSDSIASALEENLWLLGMDGAKGFVKSKQDEEFDSYKEDFGLKEVSVVLERIPEIHVIMYDESGLPVQTPNAIFADTSTSSGTLSPVKVATRAVARKSTSKPPMMHSKKPVGSRILTAGTTYSCTYPGCKMKFLLQIKLDAHIKGYHQGIKKPYECGICNKKFQCYPSYKDHDNVHLDRRLYQCSLCQKRLFTKTQLKTHLEKHKISNAKTLFVSCPVVGCKSKFPNEARREQHVKSHHLGLKRTYPCPHCDRKFKNTKEVADHQNFHKGDRPYKCQQCTESFFMEKRLRIHVQKYHQPARFECEYCAKKFYIRSQYKYHIRIHTKERPYVCDICGKDFTAPKHLRHHKTSHPELNLPGFSCETCGKKFSCPASLAVHVKIHTGEYTVTCEVCGLGCASQSVLIKHMAKHTDERNFACDHCGATYKTKGCLMKHVRDKHSECDSYVCGTCGKELSTKVSLQRHEMLHSDEKPFVCTLCGKAFPLQYYLSAHNWKCHRTKESTSRSGRPRKKPKTDLKEEVVEEQQLEIEYTVPEVESGIEDVVVVTM